jgi:hypothetical protein
MLETRRDPCSLSKALALEAVQGVDEGVKA